MARQRPRRQSLQSVREKQAIDHERFIASAGPGGGLASQLQQSVA